MGQRPAQVLAKCGSHLSGGHPGSLQHGPERRVRVGQAERLQVGRVAIRVAAQQNEVARVRDEHQPVPVPVAADLAALGCQQRVVIRRLDLDDSALRGLALARCPSLDLAGSVEAEIGVTRALVCQLRHTDDLRPERRANRVEQVGERRIGGTLCRRPTGRANAAQVLKVPLDDRGQSGGVRGHVSTVPQLRALIQGIAPGRRPGSEPYSRACNNFVGAAA